MHQVIGTYVWLRMQCHAKCRTELDLWMICDITAQRQLYTQSVQRLPADRDPQLRSKDRSLLVQQMHTVSQVHNMFLWLHQ